MNDIKQVLENYAVEGIELDRVKAFIEAGHDSNSVWPESGETLLHYAAEDANIEVIDYLIQSGANINAKSLRGHTPLHTAVDSDCDRASQLQSELTMNTVQHLINLGADERIKESRGKTARDIAATYGVLALYDAISRLDHSKEITMAQFAEKLAECLRKSGYFIQHSDPKGFLSFSKYDVPIDQWQWYNIWLGPYYYLRNSPQRDELVKRFLSGYQDRYKWLRQQHDNTND